MPGKVFISLIAVVALMINPASASSAVMVSTSSLSLLPKLTVYQMVPGITLKQGLSQWASITPCQISHVPHWQIYWQSSVDYAVDAPLTFPQDFLSAISSIIHLYGRAQIPLYAHIYQQQCLIVIDTR